MKKIIVNMIISVTVCFLSVPVFSFAQDTDPHNTGLIERTPEEIAFQAKTKPRVKKVHLNKIGLARINEQRKKQGLTELDAKPLPDGLDLETETGDPGVSISADVVSSNLAAPGELPSMVDNSALKYFPPIRTQGGLGSCGSFSGTYYTMTYMYALANDLDAKNGGDVYRLSPKWTYNMVNGGENVGSWYYWCYDIGISNGVASWSEFPYDGSDYRSWCLSAQTWKNALSRRFDKYGYIGSTGQESGITQVKQMLLNGYILNYATYVNSWQTKPLSNDPSTTADDPYVGKISCYYENGSNGYHAMTVVGYNDDVWTDINSNGVVDSGEKGAFLIANSWGAGWGNAGFLWLAYDAVRDTSAVSGWSATGRTGSAWDTVYWVTAKTNYTPKLIAQFTVNHLQRNQMGLSLGISSAQQSSPTTKLVSKMLYLQGGPYAFNGGTTAIDGTFCLDFSSLALANGTTQSYYLNAYDTATGNPLTVKSYQVIDLTMNPAIQVTSGNVPLSADANTVYTSVSYQYGAGNIPPVASFSANPTSGYSPLTVDFSSVGSYDPDGNITSYVWDFGDNISATGVNVTHTYNSYGNFTAKLTVSDNIGGIATSSKTINVANGNPSAVVTATPVSGNAPLTVSFSSAGSNDPFGTITQYAWNFGDGATSDLQNPVYTYNSPGNYAAILTVTDDRNLTGASSITINVKDPNVITTPTGLTASVSGATVALRWTDNSSNEQGFYVERGIKSKNSIVYSRVATVAQDVVAFSQTIATGTYYYRVQGFNNTTGRVSDYSNGVQVTVAGSKSKR